MRVVPPPSPHLFLLTPPPSPHSGLAPPFRYVSFVEVLGVAEEYYLQGDNSPSTAYAYATLSVFAGVLLMAVVDKLVHLMFEHVAGGEGGKYDCTIPHAYFFGKSNTRNFTQNNISKRESVLEKAKGGRRGSTPPSIRTATLRALGMYADMRRVPNAAFLIRP